MVAAGIEQFDLLLAWRAVLHSGLSTAGKLVALALLDHWSSSDPSVYPGMVRLAEMTGLCERAARKAVRSLERAGAIAVRRRNGCQNYYRLEPLMALECAVSNCRVHGRTKTTPALDTAAPHTAVAGTAVPGAPDPGISYRGTPAPRADEVTQGSNPGSNPERLPDAPAAPRAQLAEPKAGKPRNARQAAKADPNVQSVHRHWMGANGVASDEPSERVAKLVKACLARFRVEDLCKAVDAAASDSWCQQTGNTGLSYVCKDAERVRSLLLRARHQGSAAPPSRRFGSKQQDHGYDPMKNFRGVRA